MVQTELHKILYIYQRMINWRGINSTRGKSAYYCTQSSHYHVHLCYKLHMQDDSLHSRAPPTRRPVYCLVGLLHYGLKGPSINYVDHALVGGGAHKFMTVYDKWQRDSMHAKCYEAP